MIDTTIDQTIAEIEALKADWPNNIALRCFDAAYLRTLSPDNQTRFLKCLASGIANPDSEMGCYACRPSDYDDFKPFFSRAVARYHKVSTEARQVNDWRLDGIDGLPEDGVLDIARLGLPPLSMRVRVGRNLADLPLPGGMDKADRVGLEQRMTAAFQRLIETPGYGGRYHSLTPGHPDRIGDDDYRALVDAHIMFKNMADDRYLAAAGIAADWPHGRGAYVSADRSVIVWVGEEDHLRIMCMKTGTVLNEVFDRLREALGLIENIDGLSFALSADYGVVTSCPTNLGTGMRASLHIALPTLTAGGTDERAKDIARPLGLSVRGVGGEHTPVGADGTVDISPSARFHITEGEILAALYKGIEQLIAEEFR